jgi:hypothetical protein
MLMPPRPKGEKILAFSEKSNSTAPERHVKKDLKFHHYEAFLLSFSC